MTRKRATLILLSLLIAVLSGTLSYYRLAKNKNLDADFTWSRRATELFLAGENPYTDMQVTENYPFNSPFYYPITAVFVAIPFTFLPTYIAGGTFFGVGSGLMGYAILRYKPYQWPVFLSAPFFLAGNVAQWSPWLFAAALIPALQFLAACKPNVGLAAMAYRPSKVGVAALVSMLLVGLLILPSWPIDWLHNITNNLRHLSPFILLPIGPLLLLSLIHWREGAGRVILVMIIVPQLLWFYDQLLLWLIPKTWKASLIFSLISWIPYLLWKYDFWGTNPSAAVMIGIYVPALIILLLQYRRQASETKLSYETLNRSTGKQVDGKE